MFQLNHILCCNTHLTRKPHILLKVKNHVKENVFILFISGENQSKIIGRRLLSFIAKERITKEQIGHQNRE